MLRRKAEISASIAADSRFVPPPAILSPSEKRPVTASHEKTVSARAPAAHAADSPSLSLLSPRRARETKRGKCDETARRTPGGAEADKENGEKPAPKRRGRPAGRGFGKSPSAENAAPRAPAEASPERANEKEPGHQPASSGKKSTRAERAEARAAAATGEAAEGGGATRLQERLGKPIPASASRSSRRGGAEADVIEIDLISPVSVAGKAEASAGEAARAAKAAKVAKAKTPESAARGGDEKASQPPSRGPTTRSAGKSASGAKPSAGRAAASARGAGVTPGQGRAAFAATPVAVTLAGVRNPAKTPQSEKSFGKKLAAVANESGKKAPAASAAEAEAPSFTDAPFEASARRRAADDETRIEKDETAALNAKQALPEPEPEAPLPLPKLAPDLMTSFVPLAGYEEEPALPGSREKKAESRLGALRQAEAAKRAEERREEERRARKEAMMAARQAAGAAKAAAAPSPAAPAVGTSGAAAGSVMERLQRAMESRSRLEAENRAKLEADQKRKEEERRRREADAEERRRQKEAEEVREREEKKQRQEKMLKMRKEQEEAQREVEEKQARVRRLLEERDRAKAAGAAVGAKRKSGAEALDSAEEKKRRLQDFMANNRANAALAANAGAPGAVAVAAKLSAADLPTPASSAARAEARTPAAKPALSLSGAPAEFSYQISPYRENSDSESEEDDARPRKPIPGWAHSDQLAPCLYRQAKVDPDEIFVNPSKTCSLDAVFAARASSKSRRSSSGNWFHDRLTWKEEVSYKREMGFIGTAGL